MASITVVGAGGIGCVLGYALRAAGAPVLFVDADPAKVAWGRAHGVAVDRHPPLTADFQAFAEWEPAHGTTILLCTKCYDNEAVLNRLPASTTLIPVQNGFDRALEERGHAWEGIASFVSECLPQRTHTRITRAGKLHLGPRVHKSGRKEWGQARHRAEPVPILPGRSQPEVFALLRAGVRALPRVRLTEVPEILPYKYTKLMYNAAISPLAAAAGIDNGDLLMIPRARRLFFGMLRENYDILHAANIALGKIGPFRPATVQQILRRPLVSRLFAWAFYPTLHGSYCSMAGDLPRGRTEIDNYNRHLIDLAADRPCPRNRRVYELVKRMERERLTPALARLDELIDE